MSVVLILNAVLAIQVVAGIVSLLGWAIVADKGGRGSALGAPPKACAQPEGAIPGHTAGSRARPHRRIAAPLGMSAPSSPGSPPLLDPGTRWQQPSASSRLGLVRRRAESTRSRTAALSWHGMTPGHRTSTDQQVEQTRQ